MLFILFNAVGFGVSALCLVLSHDVPGLTFRTADNISANVIGVDLGAVVRFVSYRRYVFAGQETGPVRTRPLTAGLVVPEGAGGLSLLCAGLAAHPPQDPGPC
ncbi:hypothetical protein NPS01_39990 [Nocardioides psychrotolerans]|uniref:GtrA-like protein n=2 Tax=Nocardioides psychrotolerans TaxID=1005945 RepID=A0A1I3R907_9ACTN|nr:hypothetical protein NPS01_39990 [Nocardioides psychrotolerans]SFJ42262.1 GtrA-like protein [Nocardioides psychrotolerans]